MEKSKSIIPDMDGTVQNSLLRADGTIPGFPRKQQRFRKYGRNCKLFHHLEDDFEIMQK